MLGLLQTYEHIALIQACLVPSAVPLVHVAIYHSLNCRCDFTVRNLPTLFSCPLLIPYKLEYHLIHQNKAVNIWSGTSLNLQIHHRNFLLQLQQVFWFVDMGCLGVHISLSAMFVASNIQELYFFSFLKTAISQSCFSSLVLLRVECVPNSF